MPVRLAFDDEFVGGRLQSVYRGLRQEWVGHHGQDLRGFAVAGDDGGGGAVAFDDELVEVAGFGGLQPMQRQVVDLSRCRHKSTYPDLATMPILRRRERGNFCAGGDLGVCAADLVGILEAFEKGE